MAALPWILALWLFLHGGAVVWTWRRARDREPLLRHATRRSAVLAPWTALMAALSAVPRRPWLAPELLPALAPLREGWRELRDEAAALSATRGIDAPRRTNDPAIDAFAARGWTRFYLRWYGAFLPSARAACPHAVELLARIPSVRGAMFAVLPPGAVLEPHTDPFADGLRYHLGLATPGEGCALVVDGERRAWRDGEALVFDETYLHAARNDTDRERLILFCDVERPLRWPLAQRAARKLRGLLMRATAIQNEPGDPVGRAARLFDLVNALGRRREA